MESGAGESSTELIDDYESLISTTDVELLKKAWRNEKAAPEILPFEEALVKRAKEQIQLMEETVDDFAESGHDPLIASLYQMDLDRAQFLLRSYLRVRLQKIEKFMFYIWKRDNYRNRLSIEEEKFTERCIRDIGKHLEETVLSKLPDNYQSVLKQSIISEEDDMVPEPQLDTFVVAKCERATRPLYLDGSRQSAGFDNSWMRVFDTGIFKISQDFLILGESLADHTLIPKFEYVDDYFQMVPGDLCILRYRPFQEELMNRNISLV